MASRLHSDARLKAGVKLSDMSSDDLWYTESASGGIHITEPAFDLMGKGDGLKLSASGRIAVAATMACIELGRGKVRLALTLLDRLALRKKVLMVRPEPIPRPRGKDAAVRAFEKVPALCYVSWAWTAEDCQQWGQMTPVERVETLDFRQHDVAGLEPVIPIDVHLQDDPTDAPNLKPHSKALVTILFAPRPYVGVTQALRGKCQLRSGAYRSRHNGAVGWEAFRDFAIRRSSDDQLSLMQLVVQRLEDWSCKSDSGVVVAFDTIRDALISAGVEAAAAGQAYGRHTPWTKS